MIWLRYFSFPTALSVVIMLFGIGLTPDSNAYIQGGVELLYSAKYRYFGGAPISLFPPGTSASYLLLFLATKDITSAIFCVNIIALFSTYSLLLKLFEGQRIKVSLCLMLLFPFFRMAASEALWIPILAYWLLQISRNPGYYNPMLSLALLSVRYASIIPLNCYHAVLAILDGKSRKRALRNICIDSCLFILLKAIIGNGAGHSIGFGLAKFSFIENLLTAYSSLFGAVIGHWFWQLTKFNFAPIIGVLVIGVLLLFKMRAKVSSNQWFALAFINASLVAQACLLSLTYVWDSNGLRYNFWVLIPAFSAVRVIESRRNWLIASFLIVVSLVMHMNLREDGRLQLGQKLDHPYFEEGIDATFKMNQYKWEQIEK